MVNLYRVTQSLLSGRITEKVAGLTLWSIAIGMPGARKLSPQRSRRAQRKKTLPLMNTDHTDLRKDEKQDRPCNPGVTSDKSFISGVAHGRTPGAKVRGSDYRENSLKRYGRIQHSRDLSTPPRVAQASSESLNMTRGEERGARLQRGVFRNESAESGDGRIGTSAHRDTGVS